MQTPHPKNRRKSALTTLAVTGSIGSGKSAVTKLLQSLGAHIIDADVLARVVVSPRSPAMRSIVRAFGAQVVQADGRLDRKALGGIIFASAAKRHLLERILHPRIEREFRRQLKALRQRLGAKGGVIVYAVPLLFECHHRFEDFDYVLVVYAPKRLAIERVMKRDLCSRSEALRRYQSQMPIAEKVRRADLVIDNSGSRASLSAQVRKLWSNLRNCSVTPGSVIIPPRGRRVGSAQ